MYRDIMGKMSNVFSKVPQISLNFLWVVMHSIAVHNIMHMKFN